MIHVKQLLNKKLKRGPFSQAALLIIRTGSDSDQAFMLSKKSSFDFV
jgi:hypothetical protein